MRNIDRLLIEVYETAKKFGVEPFVRDRRRGFNGFKVNPYVEKKMKDKNDVKKATSEDILNIGEGLATGKMKHCLTFPNSNNTQP